MVLPHEEQMHATNRHVLKLPSSGQPSCVLTGKHSLPVPTLVLLPSVVPSPKAYWCLSGWPWVFLMPPTLAGCLHFYSANNTFKPPLSSASTLAMPGRKKKTEKKKKQLAPLPMSQPHYGLGHIFLSFGPWAAYLLGSDILYSVISTCAGCSEGQLRLHRSIQA